MSDEATTVELKEPEVIEKTEAKPVNRADLKANGWSASELEAAEKRGMIPKKDEKKEEPKVTETNTAPEKPEVKEELKKEEPKRSTLPEFTFKTPEQEKAFLDAFGVGTEQRAMYFRMKNERQLRQQAQAESKELKMRLAALEAGRKAEPVQPEVDADGNEVDPEDKPLTLKQLREMQKKEAEELEQKRSQMNERAQQVHQATKDQEEFARAAFPDFEEKIVKAKDLMQNLESLLPEKWKQTKAIKLIRDLQVAAANADQMGIDEYTAAFIAYELGSLHPESGKEASESQTDGKQPADPKKANGSLTPEQMKRIETNTQRRASSASIPGGGGKRVVSVDEVTIKELNAMTYEERQRFKEKHPDRYTKLLRG